MGILDNQSRNQFTFPGYGTPSIVPTDPLNGISLDQFLYLLSINALPKTEPPPLPTEPPSPLGLAGGLTTNNMLGMVTSNNPGATPPPVVSSNPPTSTSSTPPPPSTTPPPNPPPTTTTPGSNSRFTFNNPFYSSVTSPLLNQAGNQIGTTPLNNRQFARPEMANALLRYFTDTYGLKNGNIVTEQYAGGLGPSENELGIRFGNSNVLNAGLEYDRLQNRNGYSQQYLDAQFKDNLAPGSSGWNNYVTTGSMPGAMNSADAERAFAGNPNTDPNMNVFGLQSKLNQIQYNPIGGTTPSGWERPNNTNQTSPSTGVFNMTTNNTPFRALQGNTGFNGYASALNNRAPLYNGSYNTRGSTGTYGRGY